MTKKTIKGVAQRAKIGLEVDGVFLVDLSPDKVEKYAGKSVEVTGDITEDISLVAKPYKKGEPVSQGFASPPLVMRKITSIKIVVK